VLLTHAKFDEWPARALKEVGAEAVEEMGAWEDLLLVHSEIFLRAVKKVGERPLLAVAVANAALGKRQAVFYVGGTMMAGLHAARGGHFFNAVVYIARKLGAIVVSIDGHFPRGTWEAHMEYKFPLYLIYGGADGPPPRYIHRRGHKAVAIPMPPGAGDKSFWLAISHALKAEGPLAIHLGFDIHREDPTGYFFVSEYLFYKLGEALRGRQFYISIECTSTPKVFASALESLLAGITGKGAAPTPSEESEEALREVKRVVNKAFKK